MEQTNPEIVWLAGIMGSALLTIVGFFLHHHYKATVTFIDEVRAFNAATRQQISGVVEDISEIRTSQDNQNKWMSRVGERLAKVETKLETIK